MHGLYIQQLPVPLNLRLDGKLHVCRLDPEARSTKIRRKQLARSRGGGAGCDAKGPLLATKWAKNGFL